MSLQCALSRPCLLAVFVLMACGCKPVKKVEPPPVPPPLPPELPVKEVEPPPPPPPYVPYKTLETGSMFNGIHFRANLETLEGDTAAKDRTQDESYTVEMNVKVKVPKPHSRMEELMKLNDRLPALLPLLGTLLERAKVSPEYDRLYRNKVTAIRTNLNRLDQLPSRHNFYDCETILELQSSTTQRRALLIQADMDVDTDGSDGDRSASLDGGSRTFQPFTSYHWPKVTQTPNPFIAVWEKRIRDAEIKAADAKTSAAEVQKIRTELQKLRSQVKDMQTSSYLLGALDPFIVLPIPMVTGPSSPFKPRVGDYCVVIVGETLYPAIIGDAGPISKVGEASLLLCKQVHSGSSGAIRAMNDLKATYVIFPGSGEKPWSAPNHAKWRDRCEELLNEIGGYTGELFAWPLPPPPIVAETAPSNAESSSSGVNSTPNIPVSEVAPTVQ